MRRGNDMRTAAEAVLIQDRTVVLSRALTCFLHYILRSGLRCVDQSRNRLNLWRAIIIALAETRNAKIGKGPEQQKRRQSFLPSRSHPVKGHSK